MNVGDKVARINEQVDTAGEILEIVGDKATVKWLWSDIKTKLKLSSLQPYVERTKQEKILDQIEKNKRAMNRRGCTPALIQYLRKENAELKKQI